MPLSVFWYQPVPEDLPRALLDRLDRSITVRSGRRPPPDADYEVLVGVSPPRELFTASERLRLFLIAQAGFTPRARAALAGLDHVAVHNLHHNAAACAETALALLLAVAKRVCVADRDLREGRWTTRYAPDPQVVLESRRAVVLGHGEIGRRVAPVCAALGMDVTAVRRRAPEPGTTSGAVRVVGARDLREVLAGADVLIMALPDTGSTRGLIGARELDLLAPGAIVVDVGRAGQIDETALHQRLLDGRVGGAGIDVWPIEPTIEESDRVVAPSTLPFHELDNVVMSPHKAGWLPADDERKWAALADALNAAAAGSPVPHPVDVDAGY